MMTGAKSELFGLMGRNMNPINHKQDLFSSMIYATEKTSTVTESNSKSMVNSTDSNAHCSLNEFDLKEFISLDNIKSRNTSVLQYTTTQTPVGSLPRENTSYEESSPKFVPFGSFCGSWVSDSSDSSLEFSQSYNDKLDNVSELLRHTMTEQNKCGIRKNTMI